MGVMFIKIKILIINIQKFNIFEIPNLFVLVINKLKSKIDIDKLLLLMVLLPN